jgi:hypothetical protein
MNEPLYNLKNYFHAAHGDEWTKLDMVDRVISRSPSMKIVTSVILVAWDK